MHSTSTSEVDGVRRPAVADRRLVSLVRPLSFEAEQYRRLRQHVESLRHARGLQNLALTSPVAGDGKTLTAINLAGALAQAPGARVLLVDADLRKPAVGSTLGLDGQHEGWPASVRRGDTKLGSSPISVTRGLDVLPAGHSRPDAYDLMSSPRVGELLSEARRQYDFVVIDTPPVVPVPDSTLLGPFVDGFIVVVSANSTPRKLLGEALNMLEPSSVVGLVFNRDECPLFGYYRRHYRRYFDSYVNAVDRAIA